MCSKVTVCVCERQTSVWIPWQQIQLVSFDTPRAEDVAHIPFDHKLFFFLVKQIYNKYKEFSKNIYFRIYIALIALTKGVFFLSGVIRSDNQTV